MKKPFEPNVKVFAARERRQTDHWCPKLLSDTLAQQLGFAPDALTHEMIRDLIGVLELHRPTADNGQHNGMCTPSCGCQGGHGCSNE